MTLTPVMFEGLRDAVAVLLFIVLVLAYQLHRTQQRVRLIQHLLVTVARSLDAPTITRLVKDLDNEPVL